MKRGKVEGDEGRNKSDPHNQKKKQRKKTRGGVNQHKESSEIVCSDFYCDCNEADRVHIAWSTEGCTGYHCLLYIICFSRFVD